MQPKSWQEWMDIIEKKLVVTPKSAYLKSSITQNRVITKQMVDSMSVDPRIDQSVNQTLERIEQAVNRLGPLTKKQEKALKKHLGTIYAFQWPGLSDTSVDAWEVEFRDAIKKSL